LSGTTQTQRGGARSAIASPAIGPLAVLGGDLLAGITTGILSVPQGMAFAVIASVPPEHGLYAMIIPTIVAALIRNSPFLVTGSTNTSALVIGALMATLPAAQILGPVPVMVLITLLMGLMQIGAGCLGFGGMGKYVSKAVLLGFTCGAGVLIISGQLKNVLGLRFTSSSLLIEEFSRLAKAAHGIDFRAVSIAGITVAVIYGCSKISRLVPGALLGVLAAGIVGALSGWTSGDHPIAVLAQVPRNLPHPSAPPFSLALVNDVLGPSLAVAILGMVETISIGKALSAKARIKFYPNQELAANGAGNIVGSFFGCMPTSASWTRSVVNLQMGAKTRWVGVIAGITVLMFIVAFAPWAGCIPLASLGGIVIWIASHMFDFKAVRNLCRWSRKDAAVMAVTLLAILFMEIQYAIYLGVIASLVLLIHSAGKLHMIELVRTGPLQYREIEIDNETGGSPVALLQLEGDLFFGVVDELESRLDQIAANGARVIVVRMKRTHGIDATASDALASFAESFRQRGGRVILCGLKPDMMAVVRHSHLGAALGDDNLLPTAPRAFGSVRDAIQTARAWLKAPDESVLLRRASNDLQDAWSYSI
jgi:SulP family sulfate permease